MLMFFNTHQCNDHCEKLGLLNPRLNDKLPTGFKLIAEPSLEEIQMPGNTIVHKLCDLCRKPFETNFAHYVKKRNDNFELWCPDCTKKRDETFKSARCEVCTAPFKSSAYWFQMKKTDFPTKCSKCRLANRERMRAALEGVLDEPDEAPRTKLIEPKKAEKVEYKKLMSEWEKNFPSLE